MPVGRRRSPVWSTAWFAILIAAIAPGTAAVARDDCAPRWLPTFGGVGFDAPVLAFTPHEVAAGTTQMVAGGEFEIADGHRARHVALWTGETWAALGCGTPGPVLALASFDDGLGVDGGPSLYAAGRLGPDSEDVAGFVWRWDGAQWHDIGGAVDRRVECLHVHVDALGAAWLVAGGDFGAVGGVASPGVALWDGRAWHAFDESLDPNLRFVGALTTFDFGDGPELVAGGRFGVAGDAAVHHVARWDGTGWTPLPTPFLPESVIHALEPFNDGVSGLLLHAGGWIAIGESDTLVPVVRWNGATWTGLPGPAWVDFEAWIGIARSLKSTPPSWPGPPSLIIAGGWPGGPIIVQWSVNEPLWQLGDFGTPGVRAIEILDEPGSRVPTLWAGISFISGILWPYSDAHPFHVAKASASASIFSLDRFGAGLQDMVPALASQPATGGAPATLWAYFQRPGPPFFAGTVHRWLDDGWEALPLPTGWAFEYSLYPLRARLHIDEVPDGPTWLYMGMASSTAGSGPVHLARTDGSTWSFLPLPPLFDSETIGYATVNDAIRNERVVHFAAWEMLVAIVDDVVTQIDAPKPITAIAAFDDGSGAGERLHIAWDTVVLRRDGETWTPLGDPLPARVVTLMGFDDGHGATLHAGLEEEGGPGGNGPLVFRFERGGWSAVGPAMGWPSFAVRSLAAFDDGSGVGERLFAGGWRSATGFLLRLDDGDWTSLEIDAPLGVVESLVVHDDGTVSGPALFASGFLTRTPSHDTMVAKWGRAPFVRSPDLDDDGGIDGADLGMLLLAWGACGGPADLNDDGVVDGADLGILLSAWGGATGCK